MKKYLICLWICFVLLSVVTLWGCSSDSSSSKTSDSVAQLKEKKSDEIQNSDKIDLQNASFKVTDVTIPDSIIKFRIFSRQIDTICSILDLARDCVIKFNKQGVGARKTEYISFGQKSLEHWIQRARGADSIEMRLGIYTDVFIDAINSLSGRKDDQGDTYPVLDRNKDLNRITIFLFANNYTPQHDTKPFIEKSTNKSLPAYNLGNLHP